MVGRYPVELCCPLPVRKIIKHKSVPPKIKGGGGGGGVDIHNSCQISDNIFQCIMPNEEPGRHTGMRMNLKSEVMEVVKLRVPTR